MRGCERAPPTVFRCTTLFRSRFDVQLEDHITLFRYQDVPGMIGRVGTIFGTHGVNIVSAAVGRQQEEVTDSGRGRSEEHTSELQSRVDLVCGLLREKKIDRLR